MEIVTHLVWYRMANTGVFGEFHRGNGVFEYSEGVACQSDGNDLVIDSVEEIPYQELSETAQGGSPCRKLVVPSSGSTIQRRVGS